MNTVRDAMPRDIYVDECGTLWRCVGTCSEPTVYFEEVDPSLPLNTRARKSGGVSGLMWGGFKRIWRPES